MKACLVILFNLNYLFNGLNLQIQSHSKVRRVNTSPYGFWGRHNLSLTAWERKNQKFEKKMNTSITLMTFTGKAKP